MILLISLAEISVLTLALYEPQQVIIPALAGAVPGNSVPDAKKLVPQQA
jgi:hypothetical protein